MGWWKAVDKEAQNRSLELQTSEDAGYTRCHALAFHNLPSPRLMEHAGRSDVTIEHLLSSVDPEMKVCWYIERKWELEGVSWRAVTGGMTANLRSYSGIPDIPFTVCREDGVVQAHASSRLSITETVITSAQVSCCTPAPRQAR